MADADFAKEFSHRRADLRCLAAERHAYIRRSAIFRPTPAG
jgi:hypothetical protein